MGFDRSLCSLYNHCWLQDRWPVETGELDETVRVQGPLSEIGDREAQ